jgi:hypothetical protein
MSKDADIWMAEYTMNDMADQWMSGRANGRMNGEYEKEQRVDRLKEGDTKDRIILKY